MCLILIKSKIFWRPLKVSKFQKQIFFFLFEPKSKLVGIWWRWKPETNRNVIFLKQKYTLFNKQRHYFRSLMQKSKNNKVRFLVQMRTRKFASEIYWPLCFHHIFWGSGWPRNNHHLLSILLKMTSMGVKLRSMMTWMMIKKRLYKNDCFLFAIILYFVHDFEMTYR